MLRKFDVILNMSYLKKYDSHIFFNNRLLTFNFDYYVSNCLLRYTFAIIYNDFALSRRKFQAYQNIVKIFIYAFIKLFTKKKN